MQVSVETLNGLERKMTISVPAEKVEEEVSQRLKNLAHKAKIDGYRPGKAPFNVIKNRYSSSVREEVAREMVQSTLYEALKSKELVPAGYPSVEPEQLEEGKDFKYSATFEVYPQVEVKELDQDNVDVVTAEIQNSDIDAMLEKLREQNKEFEEVNRAPKKGDKVAIDFEGFIDGTAFQGGKADNYEITIGENTMIPGFEDGIVGKEIGKTFDLKVTFPEEYGAKDLAGKEATFKTTINKVMEGKLPQLNDAFAEKFNIQEGGLEALRKDIKNNMTRELERRVSSMNREAVFNKLLEKNAFDLPKSLVDQEIEHLKHEMFHRLFGPEHHDHEKIPDFPRALFEDQAKRRVQLGLLFSEYVKKHGVVADKERVDAMIEKLATAYETPEELREWYRGDKERMAEIESLVMEEMVSEKALENAKITKKTMTYDEIMNPKKEEVQAKDKKSKKENTKDKEQEGA